MANDDFTGWQAPPTDFEKGKDLSPDRPLYGQPIPLGKGKPADPAPPKETK